MRILRRIWDDIRHGENIDLYVTVLAALTLAFLNLVGLASQALTTSIILTTLGILAISALNNRYHFERIKDSTDKALQGIEKTLKALQVKFGDRSPAEQFFIDHMPPLAPYLEKARDIRISGVVLQRTIRDNLNIFATCLREGANIKIVLIDPDSIAARHTADEHFPLERLKAHFDATWQNLLWLSKQPNSKGTLEIRFSDEKAFANIIAIDAEKEYGIIFIEVRPQRWISGGSRPRFELRPGRDGYWFGYYKDQFDMLWKDCRPVSTLDGNK